MTYNFADAHTHLQSKRFDADRNKVVERAVKSGMTLALCTGTQPGDWQKTQTVVNELNTEKLTSVAGFGVHPWFCSDIAHDWEEKLQNRLSNRTAVLGEVGLDKVKKGLDEDVQAKILRTQLDMARTLDLPVVFHCVQAFGLLVDVLERDGVPKAGFMLHACGCAPEMLKHPVLKQAYCSFGAGVLNHPKSKTAQTFAAVDIKRLLLETDSPDIAPKKASYKAHICQSDNTRNEPANLAKMLHDLAAIRDIKASKLAQLSQANLHKFLSPLEHK